MDRGAWGGRVTVHWFAKSQTPWSTNALSLAMWGCADLIPGRRTKIPHATEQLSLLAATIEGLTPQLESPCATMKGPTRHSQVHACCN